jgi:hypothetical protein
MGNEHREALLRGPLNAGRATAARAMQSIRVTATQIPLAQQACHRGEGARVRTMYNKEVVFAT